MAVLEKMISSFHKVKDKSTLRSHNSIPIYLYNWNKNLCSQKELLVFIHNSQKMKTNNRTTDIEYCSATTKKRMNYWYTHSMNQSKNGWSKSDAERVHIVLLNL